MYPVGEKQHSVAIWNQLRLRRFADGCVRSGATGEQNDHANYTDKSLSQLGKHILPPLLQYKAIYLNRRSAKDPRPILR